MCSNNNHSDCENVVSAMADLHFGGSLDSEGGERHADGPEYQDISDLPNILIVTGLADEVFEDELNKNTFESVFHSFDPSASFHYLKSFRRARVVMESSALAAQARIHIHEAEVCGKRIKCYFAQPIGRNTESSPHLQPPEPDKQFLISPPASPPVGWEPIFEAKPIVNYDLISAVAGLAPGEMHELHAASESQPRIVVHICENPDGFSNRPGKIAQTRCPDRSL